MVFNAIHGVDEKDPSTVMAPFRFDRAIKLASLRIGVDPNAPKELVATLRELGVTPKEVGPAADRGGRWAGAACRRRGRGRVRRVRAAQGEGDRPGPDDAARAGGGTRRRRTRRGAAQARRAGAPGAAPRESDGAGRLESPVRERPHHARVRVRAGAAPALSARHEVGRVHEGSRHVHRQPAGRRRGQRPDRASVRGRAVQVRRAAAGRRPRGAWRRPSRPSSSRSRSAR